MKYWLAGIALLLLQQLAFAESCDTDCHKQCRIRTDFPPVEFIEPSCHAKCEVAKKIACTGVPVPSVPVTPVEQGTTTAKSICGSVFHGITQAVIAQCSNWDGRLDGQGEIEKAKFLLIRSGLVDASEFSGIQIRMCPSFKADGLAAERGRIYIKPDRVRGDVVSLASTIGHEMVHIRQYREMGAENFACEYSRAYVECNGCQDDGHRLERVAYAWERENASRLKQAAVDNIPNNQRCTVSMALRCALPSPAPLGVQCYCMGPAGPIYGYVQ